MYHATLGCVDRMFLLKPSKEVNNIIGSSLGSVVCPPPPSLRRMNLNDSIIRHSLVQTSKGDGGQASLVTDNVSPFLREFAGLAAREFNRLYEREGHFWAGRARVEEITSDNKAEKLLGYGACNTVKDGLVEEANHWKGFSTTGALSGGGRLVFEYVDRTLWWKNGADCRDVDPSKYMKSTEVVLHPLPGLADLSPEAQQARFRHIVRDHEELARNEREEDGITSVKGMARIEKENPFSKPSRPRERTPQPLCHADTAEEYEAYEAEYKEIVKTHRIASAAFRSGCFDVEFPAGTFRPPLVTEFKLAA